MPISAPINLGSLASFCKAAADIGGRCDGFICQMSIDGGGGGCIMAQVFLNQP